MPRPNPPRPLRGEANLARRIAYERRRADMSTEGLARRMTDHGCPINQSAIWKIESGDPPRRITYDEALAFAEVFGVPLDELAIPPEIMADQTAIELIEAYEQARQAHFELFIKVWLHMQAHPETRKALEEHTAWNGWAGDELGRVYDVAGEVIGHMSMPNDDVAAAAQAAAERRRQR